MNKKKIFLQILILLVLLFLSHEVVLASEDEKDLGVSKPRNIAKIIQPPDITKAELKKIKNTAVLISSTLPLFGQVAEDQLSMKLRVAGYNMTPRTKLSDMTQKELMKEEIDSLRSELNAYKEQLEFEQQLEKEEEKVKELKRIENRVDQTLAQITKMTANSQKDPTDILLVAKNLGLDALFLGTVFEGKRQIGFPDDKPPVTIEKIVVSNFYLQIVDVQTEKICLSIMLEYDKGENITNAVDAMDKIIKAQLK